MARAKRLQGRGWRRGKRVAYMINGTEYVGKIVYHDRNPGRDYICIDFGAEVVPPPMNNFVYTTIGDPRLRLNVPKVSQVIAI